MEQLTFHLDGVVQDREGARDFDGPLDLILHLLNRNRVEIKDIQISLILDQYLAWIRARKALDLEVASEFVVMASHLVWLKTRMMLSEEDEETREEMEKLIKSLEERQQMEEYRRMQLGADYFAAHSELGRNIYVRPAEPLPQEKGYRHTHATDELLRALADMRERTDRKLPPPVAAFRGIVGHEQYSIDAKLSELEQRFIFRPRVHPDELWKTCSSRTELIATFLALLELCRVGSIEIEDDGEDILLCASSGRRRAEPQDGAEKTPETGNIAENGEEE